MKTTLQQQREAKGLSRQDVANRLQINAASYWRIDTGERGVTMPVAEKLAHILGVAWTDIFRPTTAKAYTERRNGNGKKVAA